MMMKEGFDKEIDSLLRRRARGTAKPFADGGGAVAATQAPSHLDADELGAFAEGALPAPARIAAASHLADCDECRGVVVALSRAVGGAAELKEHAVAVPAITESAKPAAWRAWAAWLFAPRVLRLAAPVLALSVVAVVSYVALRSRDGGAPNASLREPRQSEAKQEQSAASAPATAEISNANSEGLVAQDTDGAARNAAVAGAQPPVGRGHGAGEAPPRASDATTEAAPPPPSTAAPTAASPEAPAEVAKAAPRPAVVEEAEQPPPAKSEDRAKEKSARGAEPVDEVAANDLATQQQKRGQSRSNEMQMPDGGSRNQKRGADNNASNVYNNSGVGGGAASRESERDNKAEGAPAPRRSRPSTRTEQKDDDEAGRVGETRSAAGHRFRREGNAWVDVNYKPSMSSTGVRRGTEAFRALIADIPEVGRVAGQIGGEVVVVVRGRAYRIH